MITARPQWRVQTLTTSLRLLLVCLQRSRPFPELRLQDRLPTLSASQALHNLSSTPRRPISTGLSSLDAALQGRDHDASSQGALPGGLSRGELTEVYGPPGVGKTALA